MVKQKKHRRPQLYLCLQPRQSSYPQNLTGSLLVRFGIIVLVIEDVVCGLHFTAANCKATWQAACRYGGYNLQFAILISSI